MSLLTIEQLKTITDERLPLADLYSFEVTSLSHLQATVRMPASDAFLRPGGTIAGPAMMALADYALYAAVLASIGPVELAVTTNFNINFLNKPLPGVLIAEAKLIKLGKRLAVGEVAVHSAHADDMVAHVTGTYSIPPR
ncbi:MAG: hypothetical protein ACI9FD_002199 [Gammaproteobacteria bacterium]|jgi:uncharacterized protein (TIGR00369 family)